MAADAALTLVQHGFMLLREFIPTLRTNLLYLLPVLFILHHFPFLHPIGYSVLIQQLLLTLIYNSVDRVVILFGWNLI